MTENKEDNLIHLNKFRHLCITAHFITDVQYESHKAAKELNMFRKYRKQYYLTKFIIYKKLK